MSVEIRQHRPGTGLRDFVGFHHELFRGDPAWIAPLDMEVKDRLTPGKNPFFQHAEAMLFTAWRGGRMVGRISAQICHEHLRIHQDDAGFFGFFDTIDDQEVASALLDAAAEWLRGRGMKVIRGPFNLSINEEMGILVDGFEHPPVLMMPHARPYQGALAEGWGLHKVQDLYAWKYVVEPPPPRAQKAWEEMNALPEVRFRSVNKSKMRAELDILLSIFNDAWRNNWGFVPLTEAEIEKMAQDMRLLIDEDLAFFAMVNGREVGCVVCLPNLNEAAHDLHGKLLPFGFLKLIYRLKVKQPKSARLVLLGIRTEMRGIKRYGPLSHAMYAELAHRGIAKGYEWAELGWTLEENRAINLGIKSMRGTIYKTYRMYEKPLEGA